MFQQLPVVDFKWVLHFLFLSPVQNVLEFLPVLITHALQMQSKQRLDLKKKMLECSFIQLAIVLSVDCWAKEQVENLHHHHLYYRSKHTVLLPDFVFKSLSKQYVSWMTQWAALIALETNNLINAAGATKCVQSLWLCT